MVSEKEINELEVMFPKRDFSLNEKQIIHISPLSLEDLPRVTEAFASVATLAGQGKSIPEITIEGMSQLLKIAKYCIDVPPRVIPIDKVPDVLQIIVELNMSETIVKKWQTLIETVNKELNLGQGEEKKDQALSQK